MSGKISFIVHKLARVVWEKLAQKISLRIFKSIVCASHFSGYVDKQFKHLVNFEKSKMTIHMMKN